MQLMDLTYVSKLTGSLTSADIDKILRVSRENNQRNNITGLLCIHRKYCVQQLEGNRSEINKLFNKIVNDHRHSNVTLISYSDILTRCFTQWSMHYLPENTLTNELILKYSGKDFFNPYEIPPQGLDEMMREMTEAARAS